MEFPFKVVMCGSEAFGEKNSNSDTDYFADGNVVDLFWLSRNGFNRLSSDKYEPNEHVRVVYRNEEHGIDLIFVDDLYKYERLMESLQTWDQLYNFDKKQRSKIWDLVRIVANEFE